MCILIIVLKEESRMNQDLITILGNWCHFQWTCRFLLYIWFDNMLTNTRRQSGNVPFADTLRHQVDAQQRFQEQLEVTRKITRRLFFVLFKQSRINLNLCFVMYRCRKSCRWEWRHKENICWLYSRKHRRACLVVVMEQRQTRVNSQTSISHFQDL